MQNAIYKSTIDNAFSVPAYRKNSKLKKYIVRDRERGENRRVQLNKYDDCDDQNCKYLVISRKIILSLI